jgi:hypothetical protein
LPPALALAADLRHGNLLSDLVSDSVAYLSIHAEMKFIAVPYLGEHDGLRPGVHHRGRSNPRKL